jgi:hypothetical protein
MAKQKTNLNVVGVSVAAEAADLSAADHTFANVIRGVYVGAAGDLTLRLAGDDADVTFKGLAAGTILPVAPIIVRRATSSAAFQTSSTVIGLL